MMGGTPHSCVGREKTLFMDGEQPNSIRSNGGRRHNEVGEGPTSTIERPGQQRQHTKGARAPWLLRDKKHAL